MARIVPILSETEINNLSSTAEAHVYRMCRALPNRMLVLFRLETLSTERRGPPCQGDCDVVILDPDQGLLVIEVKGGGVAYDGTTGIWSSTNRNEQTFNISDPFKQASDRKFDLIKMLEKAAGWSGLGIGKLCAGHAVLFPDLDDLGRIWRPNTAPEIIGGRIAANDLGTWIGKVFEFWCREDQIARPLGVIGRNFTERLLCASFQVQPRLCARLDREAELHGQWTNEQWRALQGFRQRRRIAVAGGAGTGKTLLAVRRAQELAAGGKRTLLLCFNAPLGDFLKKENKAFIERGGAREELLHTMTFHGLCAWWVGVANKELGKDFLAEARVACPRDSERDVQWPWALAMACSEHPLRYDAVIIDEGQDFGPAYWMPIEDIADRGTLAVFYDPNQAIYQLPGEFPFTPEQTYELTRNCRNTAKIHEISYRFYRGTPVDPPEESGLDLITWPAPSLKEQARLLATELRRLVQQEHVPPHEIAVLLIDGSAEKAATDHLEAQTRTIGPRLAIRTHGLEQRVLVDTVSRFKGLEAGVVVIWLNGQADPNETLHLFYVGLSRPRSVLVLLGSEADCARFRI